MLTRNRIEFFELLFGCAKIGRDPGAAELADAAGRAGRADRRRRRRSCCSTAPARRRPRARSPRRRRRSISTATMRRCSPRRRRGAGARRWPAGGDLVSALHVGDDRAAEGRDLHLPDGARELRQYRRRDRPRRRPTRRSSFLPFFHTAGINLHALPTLIAGGRVIVIDGFDAERLVALLEARRLDTIFARADRLPEPARPSRASPRRRSTASATGAAAARRCPTRSRCACRDLGIRVCNGMGMTETGPTAFLVDPADAWERIGSVGKPQLLCSRADRRRRRAARSPTARSATSSSPGPG